MNIDLQQIFSTIQLVFLGLLQLWKLWLILALVGLLRAIPYFWEKYKLAKSGIAEIDKMDGKTFEKYLQVKFEKLGYRVIRTEYVRDYGADLVTEKNGTKTVIQAKRYKGVVGVKAVQEAYTSKAMYECTKAMVVTNSYFSRQAKILANKNDVELWDRKEFSRNLLKIKNEDSRKNISHSIAQPTGPKKECSICGMHVSDKVYQYCLDHPDKFKGKIYCFNHQEKS